MPYGLVVATLEPAAGWDKEAAVNTFAFSSDVSFDAGVTLDIMNAVASFYTTIGGMLSNRLTRAVAGCSMKFYDITSHLGGSAYGSPLEEGTFTLPAATSTQNLPPQAAIAVTLRGRGALELGPEGPGGIRPRQRRTGRIYIGPLNLAAVDSDTGSGDHVKGSIRTTLLNAAEALQDALVDGDYAWSVWSRTAADMLPIVRAEVDDSFDVLRSRKYSPTVRQAVTFAPEPSLILGA